MFRVTDKHAVKPNSWRMELTNRVDPIGPRNGAALLARHTCGSPKVNNAPRPRKVFPKASPSPTTLVFILGSYVSGRPYKD